MTSNKYETQEHSYEYEDGEYVVSSDSDADLGVEVKPLGLVR